jgi:predicted transcriptional regulator
LSRLDIHLEEDFMQVANVKEEARRLVETLPKDATWDDLMYRIYVHQAIQDGLQDSDAGRVISVEEVRARFGLPA